MTPRLSSQAGLSLTEVAVIIGVLTLLSGILAPSGFDLVVQARDLRVQRDCEAVRDALMTMLNDLGKTAIRTRGDKSPLVELLVTDAAVPEAQSPLTAAWTRRADAAGIVDLLDRHLITNAPAGDPGRAWLPPSRPGGPGWRGAYLRTAPGADPWGRRYAVNVKHLGKRDDVIVLSAGPNGIIETAFEGRGILAGGDDVAVLVR